MPILSRNSWHSVSRPREARARPQLADLVPPMTTLTIGTPLASNATRLLLLGAGELGREVAIEAMRLGLEVVACDRYANAPAMQDMILWARKLLNPRAELIASHMVNNGGWMATGSNRWDSSQMNGSEKP